MVARLPDTSPGDGVSETVLRYRVNIPIQLICGTSSSVLCAGVVWILGAIRPRFMVKGETMVEGKMLALPLPPPPWNNIRPEPSAIAT